MKSNKPTMAIPHSDFPDHNASNNEKDGTEFGLKIAQSIQYEWFNPSNGSCNYYSRWIEYHERRLYARGEQSTAKYKNELSVNGDQSHLNLDWTIIPVIPKFTDMIVNGINDRLLTPKAQAVDATSEEKKGKYQYNIEADMVAKKFLDQTKAEFGVDAFNTDPESLPKSDQELELHMQMNFKPKIEIAEEVALDNVLKYNDYASTKIRVDRDQTEIGIAMMKEEYVHGEGIRVKYVDPASVVHSYTEDPNFEDVFYYGEVVEVPILDLKKIKPGITPEEINKIKATGSSWNANFSVMNAHRNDSFINDTTNVLFFTYKTDRSFVYKKKKMKDGGFKTTKRDESFDPQEESELFSRIENRVDVWYEGALVLGTDILLSWELSENMIRPWSSFRKPLSKYIACAPKMYKGKTESMVSRMKPFADQIQLTHLKFQQVLQRMVPDGIFIDVDGLTGVDLGNGLAYGPMEAISMYYSTGTVIGRSQTEDGEYNNAKIPIQELNNSAGLSKLNALAETYNHYMNMIRDVTGLNKASDASSPDPKSLVGLQKIAALNSNVATRHILDAGVSMTQRLCERLSLRISSVLSYSKEREEFASQIGKYHVDMLDHIKDLPLYAYGIYIEVSPDAEEKANLEDEIQLALKSTSIDLEDAIDIRQISNIKMANEMLKLRRRKKEERDQEREMMKMQAQEASNIKSAQIAAESKMNALNAEKEIKLSIVERETAGIIAKLEKEAELKAMLMEKEFEYQMQLTEKQSGMKFDLESKKEDRKDERVDKQSSQQSKMISQRQVGSPAVNFESREDSLDGIGI